MPRQMNRKWGWFQLRWHEWVQNTPVSHGEQVAGGGGGAAHRGWISRGLWSLA